jgi:hypothetical protein
MVGETEFVPDRSVITAVTTPTPARASASKSGNLRCLEFSVPNTGVGGKDQGLVSVPEALCACDDARAFNDFITNLSPPQT